MFKSRKTKHVEDVNNVTRRKRKPSDEDKLVITVENGHTEAVGGLSPSALFAFLAGGMPELYLRLSKRIHEDDGGIYMQRLCTRIFIGVLQDYLDELEDELEENSDEDSED